MTEENKRKKHRSLQIFILEKIMDIKLKVYERSINNSVDIILGGNGEECEEVNVEFTAHPIDNPEINRMAEELKENLKNEFNPENTDEEETNRE